MTAIRLGAGGAVDLARTAYATVMRAAWRADQALTQAQKASGSMNHVGRVWVKEAEEAVLKARQAVKLIYNILTTFDASDNEIENNVTEAGQGWKFMSL